MNVCVIGCGHGKLDELYASMPENTDLMIICGDFQAVRNETDLASMACPNKYKEMNSFYKYYSGELTAPVLTIFIGGNHEAMHHNVELFFGGWVAPNIYFLGQAGVINIGGLRIAGISGIFNHKHFNMGHYEDIPFNNNDMRSIYHIRKHQICQLLSLSGNIDICLSHDWPKNITNYGDRRALLKKKPFLKEDIASGRLGSPPALDVLHSIKPKYWFSAHMHVRFTAEIIHNNNNIDNNIVNSSSNKRTCFLALDKYGEHKKYMEMLIFPDADTKKQSLSYDEEWLAILKISHDRLSLTRRDGGFTPYKVTDDDRKTIRKLFPNGYVIDPNEFEITEPIFIAKPNNYVNKNVVQSNYKPNPQTDRFLSKLGLNDKFKFKFMPCHNPDEIDLDDL